MKKLVYLVLLPALSSLLISCIAGDGSTRRVYRYHHGYGPWYGARGTYGRTIVVTPPGERPEPEYEATPLPSGPEHMPDMGMPDVGGLDFDGGGFDF